MTTPTSVETFIQELNAAFERGDVAFVVDRCTDDVRWSMVGDELFVGKEALREAMTRAEASPLPRMTVDRILVAGDEAVCVGSMAMGDAPDAPEYRFCDIYQLTRAGEPLIREMTSFVIQTSEAAS